MTATLLNAHGLARQTPLFRWLLADMCARNGWNSDPIVALISLESGFKPAARNPLGTATGLIQWTNATARSYYGMTSEQIGKLTAAEQVPLIEQFFLRARIPAGAPAIQFALSLVGRPINTPPSQSLFRSGEVEYEHNKALDRDNDGHITARELGERVDAKIRALSGRPRILVPTERPAAQARDGKPGWMIPAALGAVVVAFAWMRGRSGNR